MLLPKWLPSVGFCLTVFAGLSLNASAADIAINGGFETGAFNDGSPDASWQQFLNGGIQTITTVNPSSGTYAANLNVPIRTQSDPPVDNLIKNANLEAGNLTPGAAITVSFDMRGELFGAGGVVFPELFSELTGGGTSKSEILSGGPLFPNAAWTPYIYNTTLGPDVSGGVTLQLKASCGPVEGCGVDAYFDNVSINVDTVLAGLPGDYNSNAIVDDADYAVWLAALGAPAGTLDNDIDGGPIGQSQYDAWKNNFGNVGTGSGAVLAANVPEPSSCLILSVIGLSGLMIKRVRFS